MGGFNRLIFSDTIHTIDGEEFDVLSYSMVNALLFLVLSWFMKISELVVLFVDGAEIGKVNILEFIFLVFWQDLSLSLLVFFLTGLYFHLIKNFSRLFVLSKRLVGMLQFTYIVYIASCIEYFRLFRSQMQLTFFTAVYEVLTTPKSTLSDVSESNSLGYTIFFALAYYIVIFQLWPRLRRLKAGKYLSIRISTVLVIFSVLLVDVVAHQQIEVTVPLVREYYLDHNPAIYLLLSIGYGGVEDADAFYEPAIFDGIRGDRILVDEEYPLMTGTEHAICSNPLARNQSPFNKICNLDEDGDGFDKTVDCDDENPSINPVSEEIPHNMVDEDCDGIDNPPFNVILVMLESVIPTDMQVYGVPVENTPNLLKYQDMMFVGTDFHANAKISIMSDMITTCSIYPLSGYNIESFIDEQHIPCLPRVLNERGYRTAYFSPKEADIQKSDRFSRGRDWGIHFNIENTSKTGREWRKIGLEKCELEPLFEWIDSDPGKPFMAYFRFFTGHSEGTVPRKYRGQTPKWYYDTVLYVDDVLGLTLRKLEERKLLEDTVVIITGDHTRTRGDMGTVPLIIINPVLFKEKVVSPVQASHLDITPTILDVLGIQSINSFQGRSIFKSKSNNSRVIFCYSKPWKIGLIDGRYRYRYNAGGRDVLYYNSKDVTAKYPELAGRYRDELRGLYSAYTKLYSEKMVFNPDYLTEPP